MLVAGNRQNFPNRQGHTHAKTKKVTKRQVTIDTILH